MRTVSPREVEENTMQDSNILITGGTDGMGKATALQLAKIGTRLLLVSRSRHKGNAAVTEIISASGNESVTFLQADLSLMREVRRTAAHVRQTLDRLDVLVHAAGGVFPKRRTLTDEGLEVSFAVQYLARYLLTYELLELLRAAPAPIVANIGRGAFGSKRAELDNLNGEKNYSSFGAASKFGATNYLLTLEQTARYQDITFYNYGPGIVRTAVIMGNLPMRLLFSTIGRPFSRTPEQAADDITALLTGGHPGGFYGPSLKRQELSEAESDATLSAKLWDFSNELADKTMRETTNRP